MIRRNVASFIVLNGIFYVFQCLLWPKEGAGQLDLNTATVAELQALSCVGPKTAERIVEYCTLRDLGIIISTSQVVF